LKIHLLPEPKSIKMLKGTLKLPFSSAVMLSEPLSEPLLDAVFSMTACLKNRDVEAQIYVKGPRKKMQDGDILLTLKSDSTSESYRIDLSGKYIHLIGDGLAGLFYAIQTFVQLIQEFGRQIPRLIIHDEPAFEHRGYYLDVTRGKVPTLATLKRFIDRLAALKYNQLQLYIEHTYDFRFDPDIAKGCSPLTSDDILQLDAYCRSRFIEFVPSMTCFGHLGRILSLPAYRHLAEVEWKAPDWEQATWRQRMTGATLNPRKKESKALIRNMLDEYLPLFTSGHFNACCDETYDLGRGRKKNIGQLYSQHIQFLEKISQKYNKRLMFWGDMMLQHQEFIKEIPPDCIVLDWGYSPTTRFEKTKVFIDHGLETYICPSVRGYGVVFNQTEEARGNITGYAKKGFKLGAKGLLITDWGDSGHFNMYACSLHGLALGAAMGWNPEADTERHFDRAFSLQVFGIRNSAPASVFKVAGTSKIASWPGFIADFSANIEHLPSEKVIERAREQAKTQRKRLESWKTGNLVTKQDMDELSLACEALLLNADKYMLKRYIYGKTSYKTPFLDKKRHIFAENLEKYMKKYAKTWKNANRESGLGDIQKTFTRLSKQALTAAHGE